MLLKAALTATRGLVVWQFLQVSARWLVFDKFESGAANLNLITIYQFCRANPFLIYLGPVGRLQIFDGVAVSLIVVQDNGVLAADAVVWDGDIRGSGTTNNCLRTLQKELLALQVAILNDEACSLMRIGHNQIFPSQSEETAV